MRYVHNNRADDDDEIFPEEDWHDPVVAKVTRAGPEEDENLEGDSDTALVSDSSLDD